MMHTINTILLCRHLGCHRVPPGFAFIGRRRFLPATDLTGPSDRSDRSTQRELHRALSRATRSSAFVCWPRFASTGDFGEEDHEYVHVSFATQQSKTNCIHGKSMMQKLKHQCYKNNSWSRGNHNRVIPLRARTCATTEWYLHTPFHPKKENTRGSSPSLSKNNQSKPVESYGRSMQCVLQICTQQLLSLLCHAVME